MVKWLKAGVKATERTSFLLIMFSLKYNYNGKMYPEVSKYPVKNQIQSGNVAS